jgi:hypothetical protein
LPILALSVTALKFNLGVNFLGFFWNAKMASRPRIKALAAKTEGALALSTRPPRCAGQCRLTDQLLHRLRY